MTSTHPDDPFVPCVLYMDGLPANRQLFTTTFRKDFKVITIASLEEAWPILEARRVDMVICGQQLPGMQGCEALRRIRERYPLVRRMLFASAAAWKDLAGELNLAGPCQCIREPWDAAEVCFAVQAAYGELQAQAEREAYTGKLLEANRQLEFALRQRLLS